MADSSTTDSQRLQVLVVYGTRPEAVKMAPVIWALSASSHFHPLVVVTAQHRSMLDQVNSVFGITADVDLNLHRAGQTLANVTVGTLTGVQRTLDRFRPDAVLVQGDTTTSFAAALAACYAKIPLVHLEAGLRTGNPRSPFPEEINRRLTTRLADLHLAPTASSRANLIAENVNPDSIIVTGNTVIDALLWIRNRNPDYGVPALSDLDGTDVPVLLVTAHRRESWGEPMRSIARAIKTIAIAHPQLTIVFPIHANPQIREVIVPVIGELPNVRIIDPLPYDNFVRLMDRSSVILTDSGGIQEEAPSLGKPVLVMRDNTERLEGLTVGNVKLVGTTEHTITSAVDQLLADADVCSAMAKATNPYGDGRAAERIVAALAHYFGIAPPADEFTQDGNSFPWKENYTG